MHTLQNLVCRTSNTSSAIDKIHVGKPLGIIARLILVGFCSSFGMSVRAQVSVAPPSLNELPSQGEVVAGAATIAQSEGQMDITQSTSRAAINWETFNVGANAQVNFHQPDVDSVTLNRVLGTQPSQIFGNITSNGHVFLTNSSGVYFSRTASVDVGSLVATTLGMTNENLMSGDYTFNADSAMGSVVNSGEIRAAIDGYIALLAPEVRNEGVLIAQMGVVAMASGEAISLTFDDSSHLAGVVVESATIKALIENNGAVYAPGGMIILSALAADRVQGGVIRNSGTIEATGLTMRNGRIVLEASDLIEHSATGTINVSGQQGGEVSLRSDGVIALDGDILAQGFSGVGGEVIVSADQVNAEGSSTIDVSGASGGEIYLGGGARGLDSDIGNASQTIVGAETTLNADALTDGDGGTVIVWADGYTSYEGDISARGGVNSGDGGFVEVSGKELLNFNGTVDAGADNGEAGSLLLDPKNISVSSDTETDGLTTNALAYATNNTGDSIINPSTITAVTDTGTAVTLQASNDITIVDGIIMNNGGGNGGTLNLEAGRSVAVQGTIYTDNGDVNITINDSDAEGANRDAGAAEFSNQAIINAGTGTVSITGNNAAGSEIININTGTIQADTLNLTHSETDNGGTITLGAITLTGDATITASTGVVDINNTTSDGTIRIQGTTLITTGGDVDIQGTATDLEILGVTANDVTIYDKKALQIGASGFTSTISGDLFLDIIGPVGNTGVVNVAGMTIIKTTDGGFGIDESIIDLDDYANDFNELMIEQDSSGTSAYVQDANAIVIGGSFNTNLTITTAGAVRDFTTGEISAFTDPTFASGNTLDMSVVAPLTVSNLIVNSGSTGNVTIDHADTDFNTIQINNALNVLIVDTDALELYTSDIQGSYDVTAGGSIYLDYGDTLTVDAGLSLQATSGNVYFEDYGDITVTGDVTLTSDAGTMYTGYDSDFTITSGNLTIDAASTVTLGQNSNIDVNAGSADGDLAITAGGTITQNRSGNDNGTVTIDGASSITVTAADSNFLFSENGNSFAGIVTLAATGLGSYYDVDFRNADASNAVLSGLESAGTLHDVSLFFDNATAVNLPGMNLTNNLEVVVPNGAITQTDELVVAGRAFFEIDTAEDITLTDADNDFNNLVFDNANDVTLVEVNGFNFLEGNYEVPNASDATPGSQWQYTNLTGNLTVTAGGNVTQTNTAYGIRIDGIAQFTMGANDLTLPNSSYNQWNQIQIVSANDVDIRSTTSIDLLTSNITGTLRLQVGSGSNDSLTQDTGTTLTVGGDTSFYYFDSITLDNSGNSLGDLLISDGNNSGYGGTTTIREDDAITQSASWTARYDDFVLTTEDDQAITLDQTSNRLSEVIITQVNNGAGSAGAVFLYENEDFTQNGAWTTHGNTTVSVSGSNDIYLTNVGNVLGDLDVNGDVVYVYENDTITDFAAWGTGLTYLNAYASGVSGDGNILLDFTSNVMGDLVITAEDVTITENNTITDYTTAWNAPGDVVLNAGTASINLDNTSNILGGIDIDGSPSSVLITEGHDITQSGAWVVGTAAVTLNAGANAILLTELGNIMGDITLTTSNGTPTAITITEDSTITQSVAWSVGNAPVTVIAENANTITLTHADNIVGNLIVTGGTVSIREDDGITDGGAWTTTGTTTLNPGVTGSTSIVLDAVGHVLGAVAIAGSPQEVTITESDSITQASAWSLSGIPVNLAVTDNNNIVMTQAANILGELDLTAGGSGNLTLVEADAIVDSSAWTVGGTAALTAVSGGTPQDIVLNAAGPAGTIGTLQIVNAADVTISADIDVLQIDAAANFSLTDSDGVDFNTSSVTTLLSIDADGHVTQTGGEITAAEFVLVGNGYATLNDTSNDVDDFAAAFSGGDLQFTDADDFAVATVDSTVGIGIGANAVTLVSVAGTITGTTDISSATGALTINTGTALVLPNMVIAGSQDFTAGGSGISLTSDVQSTASGAINFHSPLALTTDIDIQSNDSAIIFDATVAGATNILTVNAGTSTITFSDAVSGLGALGDAQAALNLTGGGVGSTFSSTLAANNGITVTGPVIFRDDVTLSDGNAASIFAGLVTLGAVGGMDLSAYDTMRFSGGVLLANGASTINSNNSLLTFENSAITGPYALTLNSGTSETAGLNLVGTDLTSLTVNSKSPTISSGGIQINGPQSYTATDSTFIRLQGNITSTSSGVIDFNSPFNIEASATVTTVDSAVNFDSTVNGPYDLSVDSGTATTTFSGTVGNTAPLGDGTGASIILLGSGSTQFDATIETNSGMTAVGPVTFDDDVTLDDGDTGSTFTGLVTSGGSDGNIIDGFDGIAFDGGLALVGGPVSVISNGSTISFGSTVSGPQNLILNALLSGAGTVTDLDEIGFTSDITDLSITAHTLSLPSTGLAVAGDMDFTASGGLTLNGAVGNSAGPATGQIDFLSAVDLATGAITITNNDDAINFVSTVDGGQTLSLANGAGTTTFGGAVGATTPLTSVTSDSTGTTAINGGSIATSGAQTYNDAVTVGASTILTGVNVDFVSTLNGANTLLINDSGATTFGAVVGGVDPLSSLTTNSAGTTEIATTAISTSGAQVYNDPVTLSANTVLVGAPITFNGILDGTFTLDANAGAGALTFADTVGGVSPLVSLTAAGTTIAVDTLTTSGTQAYTAASGTTLNADLTTTNSNITFTGPSTLGANLQISTGAGAGNINFSGSTSTLNGVYNATLSAGTGNVVHGGVVGGTNPLTGITVTGFDLTLPGINTVSDSNQSYTALNDLTLSQSRTLNAPISFTADSDNSGSGSFILLTGISLTASNNTLSIIAADLDLQGSSTLASGSGLMTLTASDARNIALGGSDAAGQMTISGSELSRITTSGGLDLVTTGAGWVHVNGITASQSQNITGVLSLEAQGTGDVDFITTTSTFNALTANSTGGNINVGVDLSTTNDAITFETAVAIAGASTISSGGGSITFDDTVAVDNDLTLTTSNGVLTFSGAVGSNQALELNLGGGSVSGLGQLQSTLTGLIVNSSSGISLPAFTINGPQTYNTGVITATGDLTGVGLTFNNLINVVPGSGSTLALNAGTGTLTFNNLAAFNANDLTLTGDEIDFTAAVTGSGAVHLQPSSTSRNVAIGGSGAPISGLNLTSTDIGWLPIGTLSSLTFGRADGTGTLDMAGSFSAPGTPVTLHGGNGISQTGGSLTSGALSLRSDAGIALANSANSLGAISITGSPTSVSIADSTDITQGAAWSIGTAPVTLNANSGANDITLTQAGNAFGTLVLTGSAVAVTEAASTDLGASSAATLTVVSTDAISTSGTVVVSGLADLTTLNNAGAAITIANSSTFGSVNAASRNAANNADTGGDISLTLNASSLLSDLATTGDISLQMASGQTFSQNGSSSLSAAGLELLGSGATHTLTLGTNAITTLAGNTGDVSLVENSGFAIGTVNTVGLTTSGDTTLSTTATVTQSALLAAAGVELLGTAGDYTLTNTGNAITTLAGDTGVVSFLENSGFAIGTVNTTGLTTSGNTTLSSTGTVTESEAIVAAGLELLGASGIFTLTNTGNAITTLAGNTGDVSVVENSGFAIGSVNTTGLTTSGDTTLSSTGTVTQSELLAADGLELLGSSGVYTLTDTGNAITTLAANTGVVSLVENSGFAIGTVNTVGLTTSGNTTLSSTGTVTESQAIVAPGLELLGTSGVYTLTNTGNAITTLAGNTGAVSLVENSGFAIGTVNTTGLTTSGDTTLSSTATVTQSELLAADGLELLGTSGAYTLTNTGNAITTLAGNTGVVSFLENSGFAIGTVNTAGLTTSGNTTLSSTGTVTASEAIVAPGLELLGTSGVYTLTDTSNAITTLAGNTGVVSFVENSGFAIGTVNTVGLTTSGNTTLSSTGTVTESQAIVATGLELLGTSGVYTLTNTGNAITTLAGNTGTVSLVENSGFAIGTVNTAGLTTSGDTTLSSTATVTQSALLAAVGVELLGTAGDYTLTNTGNAITTLAGDTGVVSFLENSGFAIGTVNTTGLTTSGNTTLSSTGTVTESEAIVAAGLELLGANGIFTLTNTGNAITTLAGNTGDVSVVENSGFAIGSVNTTGLTTSGDTTLSSTGTVTQSELLAADGLELLGSSGAYTLTDTGNAIATLAGNTGVVSLVENSGFAIGTVNTVGLTTSGNTTLSSTGTVTESQAIVAPGLELLGVSGIYTLTDTGNAITTLAGDTGDVNLVENSGFAIGTVNTVGLTTSGDTTLSSTATVTQSELLAADGLELLGASGIYTLTNTSNAITTLAGNTGVLSLVENSGFAIGTVNTTGLTTSGNATLSTTGTVTQTQDLASAGLELLGTGGSFVLSRDTNTVPVLAGNTGNINVSTAGALSAGTVNTVGITTTGNLELKAGGIISQTQPLVVTGNLTLETTHAAGDASISNLIPSTTTLGESHVGGDYVVTATSNAVVQFAGSSVQVAGDFTVDGATLTLGGAGNLVQGTTTTPTVSELRQSGVITLGNVSEGGNYSVTSTATSKNFDNVAQNGSAVVLNNASNSVGGYIAVTTDGPSVTSGSEVQTGIQQSGGTTISIAGVASFTAESSGVGGSGFITLTESGNDFGSLVLSGAVVNVTESTGSTILDSANATTSLTIISAGSVTQTGELLSPQIAITANGVVTLDNVANEATSIAIDSNGNIVSYSDASGFDVDTLSSVTGIDTGGASLTLVAGGSGNITQTTALTGISTLTATAGGSIDLDVNSVSNTIDTIGDVTAGAGIEIADSAGGLLIDGDQVSTTGNITIRTIGGTLTLADTRTITVNGAGEIYLEAGPGFDFINSDSTPGSTALIMDTGRFIIYSVNNATIVAGGLTGTEFMGETYIANGPATQSGRSGNLFLYNDTATLFFEAVDVSRDYGASNPTFTYNVTGYLAGDNAASSFTGDPNLSTSATSASNVNTYTITSAVGTLTSIRGYVLQYVDGTLTVDPYAVDLSGTQVYDGSTGVDASDLTIGTLVGGETLNLSGTGSVTTEHVGTIKTLTLGGLSLSDGTGLASNYTFTGGTQTVDITAAPITLSTSNVTRVYNAGLSASGTAIVVSGTAYDSLSGGSFAFTDANVGSGDKVVTASGVTISDGNSGNNYTVSYANNTTSTITPYSVDITGTRVYDGTTVIAAGGLTLGTLVGGETLGLTGNGSVADKDVGTSLALTLDTLALVNGTGSASNYTFSGGTQTTDITAASITLSTSDVTRTYDGGLSASGTAVVVSGTAYDSISGGSFAFTDANASSGDKVVTTSGVTIADGNGGSNYSVSYANNTTSTINPASLTLSTSNVTRAYDGSLSASGTAAVTSGTLYTNVSNGNALDSLSGGSFAFTNANASSGDKVVTATGVTVSDGNSGNNYTVSYANNTTSTISPASLTLSTSDVTRTYDGSLSASGTAVVTSGTLYTNVSNGSALDSLSGGSFAFTDADASSGDKVVTASGVTITDGNSGNNYSVSYANNTTSTINTYAVDITGTRVYDGTTVIAAGGLTLGTLVGSETLGLTGNGSVADKDVGTSLALTLGSLALVDGTGSASNYTFSGGTQTTDITAAPITFSTSDVTRVYDGSLSASGTAVVVSGTAYDSISGGSFAFTDANVGSGDRVVSASGVTIADGNSGNNYSVSYANNTTSTITPASLTLSTSDVTRTYDGSLSASGTAVVTSGTLYTNVSNGSALDSLSGGSFAFTDADASSGDKVVTASGVTITDGNSGNNYSVSYANNTTSTINTYAVDLTGTQVYDGSTVVAAGSLTLGTLVGSETLGLSGNGSVADKDVGTSLALTLGSLALVDGTGSASNYIFSGGTQTSDITAASITFSTSDVTRVYDGSLSASGTAVVVSGTAYDSISGGSFAFTDANVGSGDRVVSASGVTIADGNSGNNYSVSYANNTTSTITTASLTLSTSDVIKTYDGNLTAIGSAVVTSGTLYTNVSNGSALDSLSGGSFAFTGADASSGDKVVTASGVTITDGNSGNNYSVSYANNTTSTVNPAALTLTPLVDDKAYDGNTLATVTGYTVVGLIGTETLTISDTAATFADQNVGVGIVVNNTGIALADGSNGGLALNYSTSSSAATTADITPRALTLALVVDDKTYDGNTTGILSDFGLSGFVSGESVTAVSSGSVTFDDRTAGTGKDVTITGISLVNGSGGLASNYSVSASGLTTATINQADVTVAGVVAIDRVYDGTVNVSINSSVAELTGIVSGDDVSVGTITGVFTDKNVGTDKSVTGSNFVLSGADGSNYNLIQPTGLTASITPLALNVAAAGLDRVYDATTDATVTISDNRISGDSITLNYSADFLDKDVGVGKFINVTGINLSGADAANYTPNSTAGAFATISQASLTVSASGVDRVYDATTVGTVTLADDRLSGDTLTVSYSTVSFIDKNVGVAKDLTVSGINLTGTDAANYTVSTSASTTATISQASLIVSASGVDRVYDATAVGTATLADDRLSGDALTVAYSTVSFIDKDVGVGKDLTVSGITLSGSDAGNYTVNTATTTTATISQATLTVSASGVDRVYDATNVGTVTLADDRISGDAFTVAYSTVNFIDKNVGVGKDLTVSGINLTGTDAANYTVSTSASTTATISQASLTVSASGVDRVYDTTAVGTVNLVDDRLSGDAFTVAYSTVSFIDKNVGVDKDLTVSGINLTGTDAANYTVNTETATTATTATISQASLTISASGVDRVYDATAVGTVTLADDRLSGDALTIAYGSASFTDKNVGVGKDLNVSGLSVSGADAGNYIFNTVTATTADITPATLLLVGTGVNRIYDTTDDAMVTMTDDRFSGDVITVNYDAVFTDKNVGTGKIINLSDFSLSGADAGNYQLANSSMITSADITQAVLTVSAEGIDRIYDATLNASATLSDNRLSGDMFTLSYSAASFDDKNVADDKVVSVQGISLNGADAANYSFNDTASSTATIERVELLIVATADDKIYDRNAGAVAVLSSTPLADDSVSFTYQTAMFNDQFIGEDKTVTVDGISILGTDAGNYSINSIVTTTAAINRNPETVTLATIATVVVDVAASTTVNVSQVTSGVSTVNVSQVTSGAPTVNVSQVFSSAPVVSFVSTAAVITQPATVALQNGVQVMMIREPTESGRTINKIFATVPRNQPEYSDGFSFALPIQSMDVANVRADQITTVNGKPLPSWLKYNPETSSFTLSTEINNALPYKVLISIGGKHWVLTIQQRESSSLSSGQLI